MIMADKFAEGRLKKTSCYPVYITLMNILASVRYRPSSVALLALLPHFPSSKVKNRPEHKNWARLRTLHHCLAIIFDPLNHFQEDGLYLKKRDGTEIWVQPFVSYMNSDNQEQDDQAGLKRGCAVHSDRQTLMLKDLIGSFTTLQQQRGPRLSAFVIRTDATHRAAVEKMWELVKGRTSRNDGTMGSVKFLIDEYSIHPVQNAYWNLPMAEGGIYAATPAEILHLWPQGVMAAVKEDVHELFELVWKNYRAEAEGVEGGISWAVDLVENRMRTLPQFTDGITSISHFENGVWALKWVSAEDHISMFQQLVSRTNPLHVWSPTFPLMHRMIFEGSAF